MQDCDAIVLSAKLHKFNKISNTAFYLNNWVGRLPVSERFTVLKPTQPLQRDSNRRTGPSSYGHQEMLTWL